MKCQLKPVDFAGYKVTFLEGAADAHEKVFPDGVCDWSKPSVGIPSSGNVPALLGTDEDTSRGPKARGFRF